MEKEPRYFAKNKRESKLPAATWMDLEIIIPLSEVNQKKTNIIGYHIYVESRKKLIQINFLQNRNRLTNIEIYDYQRKNQGGVG